MIKKALFHILLILCSLSFKNSHSQQFVEDWDGVPNLERHQFTLNLFTPGVRYELGVLKNLSVSLSFNPGIATYEEGYSFGLVLHTRVRYYHNFKTRYNYGREVVGNSANYFGLARSSFFEPLQLTYTMEAQKNFSLTFFGVVYGLQRTNLKGFNITVELGAGYYDGFGVESGFGPLINFTFGKVLTNAKARKTI